jgi:hypothetical protein
VNRDDVSQQVCRGHYFHSRRISARAIVSSRAVQMRHQFDLHYNYMRSHDVAPSAGSVAIANEAFELDQSERQALLVTRASEASHPIVKLRG